MIADPFTKLHCCIRSDGGGAIVLTSEERARDCAEHADLGARDGRGDLAHDDERVARLHRVTVRPLGQEGLRAGRRHPRRTSTSWRSTTRSPSPCCSPWRASASARRVRAARSSKAGRCASAVRCRPTPTVAGSRSCQPGMRGIFLLVEAVEAAAGRMRRASGPRRPPRLRQRDRWLDLLDRDGDPRPRLSDVATGPEPRLGPQPATEPPEPEPQPDCSCRECKCLVSRYSSKP